MTRLVVPAPFGGDLILVRHAPTAFNKERRFMGQLDVPLDTEGRDAARAARARFSTFSVSTVVTSPLQRAVHTAEELYPDMVALVDDRLAERHLGAWEGALKLDVKRHWPHAFIGDRLDPSFTPPDAETWLHFRRRVRAFLDSIADTDSSCGSVVVVTHNGVIRALRQFVGGIQSEDRAPAHEPHLVPLSLCPDLRIPPDESER